MLNSFLFLLFPESMLWNTEPVIAHYLSVKLKMSIGIVEDGISIARLSGIKGSSQGRCDYSYYHYC